MGFDNECILNIQSLAGEYFCPVCRLLVYPNEALQSQCTHLYCKPCLTYVVSTTRACPYDGYLVTEADSKPLIESNKTLAETIGKVTVRCLFQRSGCTWQGTLSDCILHCAGCAFGNSPVVCNRCSVQIVHRQVQEHAQVCPGVQTQAQPQTQAQLAQGSQDAAPAPAPAATVTSAAANQPQAVAVATQTQTSVTSVTAGSVAAVQAAAPAASQWYQQQPQYQQYYQQYPGYDPYQQQFQQHYAQYQQPQPQAQPPPQPQAQPLPQPQLQSQTQTQPPVVAQPPNPALVNTPQQTYPAGQHATHAYAPQLSSYPQTFPVQPHNLQTPQYQQPFPQMQQAHPQVLPQAQNVQPYTQPLPQPLGSQTNQAQVPTVQSVASHQPYPQIQPHQQIQPGTQQPAPVRPQSGSQLQSQVPIQVQSQFPQQPAPLRPPQQPGLLPLPGQTVVIPTQQQAVQSYNVHPGVAAHQHPGQSVQQSVNQQYGQYQQPLPGHPSGPVQPLINPQSSYLQPQLRPQGPPLTFPQNALLFQGLQPHQTQAGRPMVQPHGVPQIYAQSTFGMQVRPMQGVTNQHLMKPENSVEKLYEQKSGSHLGPLSENLGTQKNDEKDVASGLGSAGGSKSVKSENDLKSVENEDKFIGNSKEVLESRGAEGAEHLVKKVKDELLEGRIGGRDVSSVGLTQTERPVSDNKEGKDLLLLKTPQLLESENPEMKMQKDLHRALRPQISHGPSGLQQRPPGPSLFQAPHPGSADRLPGFLPGQVRPLGTAHLAQPHSLEIPAGGSMGTDIGRGPGHSGSLHGPSAYGHVPPSHSEGTPSEMSTDGRLVPRGQQSGVHSNAMRMNGPPALNSTSTHGLHDDRFRSFANQHPFADDTSRHLRQVEEGLKHFPGPSQLDRESALGHGPRFSSSRPLDRGPNFETDVGPRPFDLDPLGGPRPFPPYHRDGTLNPSDLGERPIGFHEPSRPDSGRAHKDFAGPGLGFVPGHMVGLAPRSPGRDYPGLSSSGFGSFPFGDDMRGRESQQFADPIDSSFRDGRFGRFPGHFSRGDFEASSIRTGDHVRTGASIGLDGPPYHFWRGEHVGLHSLPGHLLPRDGFGALPGQFRMEELAGPEPVNYHHPRFGEPGFRSSFSKGFPGYGGKYAGNMASFDGPKKRKSASMGWCRICKVDCETVEGLDLHSQTREHQKMTMDMVLTIKQNAKKMKTTATDNTTQGDETKNASSEDHGNKH